MCPWPDRIFGPKALYPSTEPTKSEPTPVKTLIPKPYETELQTVFHALGDMQQPAAATHWETAGTQDIGVLVSDTLMFERAAPSPSDEHLGNFYGLALPLLMRGMPVEPVQIESASSGKSAASFLSRYKILLLTYQGQKPPSPEFHTSLTKWVKAGGALIVVDDDKDPYNRATDWWDSDGNHFATPREHLFRTVGIAADAVGLHAAGKGFVLYAPESPAALTYSRSGSEAIVKLLRTAAGALHLQLKETNSLVLRRGPYVIAAGLEREPQDILHSPINTASEGSITGDLINLFDANLGESNTVAIKPGTHALLLDVNYFKSSAPRILAASARIMDTHTTADAFIFHAEGIDQTQAAVRILTARTPRDVMLNDKILNSDRYRQNGRTLLLHFVNTAALQKIQVDF